MPGTRVLVVLPTYPATTETYMQAELAAVMDDFDVHIVARGPAEEPYADHFPFRICADTDELVEVVEDVRPHVMHTHWMNTAPVVADASERTGVPFTVRSHSFDTLIRTPRKRIGGLLKVKGAPRRLERAVADVQRDSCLGVLVMPFAESRLRKLGVPADKVFVVPPVIDIRRFRDRGSNGDGVMNTGACLPKKQMGDFIDVAKQIGERPFRIYAVGDDVEELRSYNQREGSPATLMPLIEPGDMPGEYKKAEWLLGTASPEMNRVGWPLSIAEAQAAGVGVVMRNLRPDLKQYVGDAGFLYDSLDDAIRILKGSFPEEMRERGFEHAEQWDVSRHIHVLTDLWRTTAPAPT